MQPNLPTVRGRRLVLKLELALYRKVLNLGVPSAHGHLEALKQFPQSVAAALFDEGARAKMRGRWRRAGAARSLL